MSKNIAILSLGEEEIPATDIAAEFTYECPKIIRTEPFHEDEALPVYMYYCMGSDKECESQAGHVRSHRCGASKCP